MEENKWWNNKLKTAKLSELEHDDILHITKIPEKAKWVAFQKSMDTKAIKVIRKNILSYFSGYCSAIFVDEAQDMSEDIYVILSALERAGIEIILYGDPKQDVRGYGCFRQIIDSSSDVHYFSECYRCPQIHLNLSNTLAHQNEKQVATCENKVGSLEIVFETDIEDVRSYVENRDYGLRYISQKKKLFYTHSEKGDNDRFEALRREVFHAIKKKHEKEKSEIEIERAAFFVTEKMLKKYDETGNAEAQISYWVNNRTFDRLNKKEYSQMISAFSSTKTNTAEAIVVSSIEIVKGLEAKRCLFILTSDLAPYLFGINTDDNKMRHLLYVALTRSTDHLTILITQDVEKYLSREFIFSFFKQYSVFAQ